MNGDVFPPGLGRERDLLLALLDLHAEAEEGVFLFDLEGRRFTFANEAASRILGYSRAEIEAMTNPLEIVVPEERAYVQERHERRMRGEKVATHYEVSALHKDGSRVAIEVVLRSISLEGRRYLIVLARDATGRRQVEGALKEAASLLEATLESTADGLLAVDLEQRPTRHNRKFVDMWKVPEFLLVGGGEDAILRHMREQLKDPEGFTQRIQELRKNEAEESFDVIPLKDGRVFERYSMPQRIGGAIAGRVFSFRDVTKRKRAEELLRRRADQVVHHQRILLEMTKRQADDVVEAFRHIVELDARTLDVERVSIWFFDEDRKQIECSDLYVLSKAAHEKGLRLSAKDYPAYFAALEESRTIAAHDAREDPRTREYRDSYLVPLGITSMLDVPIRLHGKVLGVLCHEHVGPLREWSLEDQDFAAEVANLIALSVEATQRKRAEELVRQLNLQLEERVRNRTTELEAANRELEAFSYSVSHDLRQPLRTIDGFSQALVEDYGPRLDEEGRHLVERIRSSTQRMARLIDDLLNLARVSQSQIRRETVDLSGLSHAIIDRLRQLDGNRDVEFVAEEGLRAHGDTHLLTVAMENLLGNAWKYTSKTPRARIEFGARREGRGLAYFVRDNGAGFDPTLTGRLFIPFQRLHHASEFEGSGIGLATVQRIIHRHGGRAWAEGAVGRGATFYFTLGEGGVR